MHLPVLVRVLQRRLSAQIARHASMRCGLWRRGGVYQYRVRVPVDLIGILGTARINRTLIDQTDDLDTPSSTLQPSIESPKTSAPSLPVGCTIICLTSGAGRPHPRPWLSSHKLGRPCEPFRVRGRGPNLPDRSRFAGIASRGRRAARRLGALRFRPASSGSSGSRSTWSSLRLHAIHR